MIQTAAQEGWRAVYLVRAQHMVLLSLLYVPARTADPEPGGEKHAEWGSIGTEAGVTSLGVHGLHMN